MEFKTEVGLLILAIVLFAVAMFFYSYQGVLTNTTLSASLAFPYRGVALAFVGIGSVSMLVASISYQKKSKNIIG